MLSEEIVFPVFEVSDNLLSEIMLAYSYAVKPEERMLSAIMTAHKRTLEKINRLKEWRKAQCK